MLTSTTFYLTDLRPRSKFAAVEVDDNLYNPSAMEA